MRSKTYRLGIVGLGAMGKNLCLNASDHDISVLGLDRNEEKASQILHEARRNCAATTDKNQFLRELETPRTIILLVPAGTAVDTVIEDFLPHLGIGDLIIDSGNSYYKDTDRRQRFLRERNLHFVGMGISGGAAGARHGASLMPGGERIDFERIQDILEALAAKVNGEPCVTYLGPGACGHYVKMVHNGIEYGLMQSLAESYDFIKRGLGLENAQIRDVFADWGQRLTNSFLVEITVSLFEKRDASTGKYLIDQIQDVARQKGTGRWASQDAMDLQVPFSVIDAAVGARELSALKAERLMACEVLRGPKIVSQVSSADLLKKLVNAYHLASLIAFSQGMALLGRASETYHYSLSLEAVARIWRGGCIIRSSELEPIRSAFRKEPALSNLLLDASFAEVANRNHHDLREIVGLSASLGIPVPTFMAALAYYDAYRSRRLPANLTEAQRDYFGAHGYERVDMAGVFHTDWSSDGSHE